MDAIDDDDLIDILSTCTESTERRTRSSTNLLRALSEFDEQQQAPTTAQNSKIDFYFRGKKRGRPKKHPCAMQDDISLLNDLGELLGGGDGATVLNQRLGRDLSQLASMFDDACPERAFPPIDPTVDLVCYETLSPRREKQLLLTEEELLCREPPILSDEFCLDGRKHGLLVESVCTNVIWT